MMYYMYIKKYDQVEQGGSSKEQMDWTDTNLMISSPRALFPLSSLTIPHENKGTNQHDDGLEGVCVNNWGQAPCVEKEKN